MAKKNFMEIGKNQAIYKALPGCWHHYSESGNSAYSYSTYVSWWNTKPVEGIYKEKIIREILRRIRYFSMSNGKIVDFSRSDIHEKLDLVEVKIESSADEEIKCKMNPLLFYCTKCGKINYYEDNSYFHNVPYCCNSNMAQLQFVNACSCGFAEGVKPFRKGYNVKYFPSKDLRMFQVKDGEIFRKKRFEDVYKNSTCPECGGRIFSYNALNQKLFYPQTCKTVNLIDERYNEIYKKEGRNGELLILAKWLGLIDNTKYNNILDSADSFFHPEKNNDLNEQYVQMLMTVLGISREEAIAKINGSITKNDINSLINDLRKVLPSMLFEDDVLEVLSSELIEFDTLKNPRHSITLENAIKSGIEKEHFYSANEVTEILERMGISNIQVSELVEILNYAYGYTRIYSNPLDEPNQNLSLRAFPDYKVYTSKLGTEGILIEFDRRKIFNWLIVNGVIEDDYEFDDNSLKVWFLENVHLNSINQFSDISDDDKITKYVYTLIHTMSHLLIESAGLCSGLSKDSISEILFPNVCATFIYSTTIQGITMGSLSGMFESDILNFLKKAYSNYETCTFDPICTDTQNGACVACTFISDVACTHFNKDLSRILLYGENSSYKNLKLKKGFWK